MKRKKRHEDHVNHEAWAIPYGDLVTLLLAFFVVMYAVSSVNEGKYRVLADSLVAAFRGPPRAMAPIQSGAFQVRADQELHTGLPRTLVPLEVDRRLEPYKDDEAFRDARAAEPSADRFAERAARGTGLGPGDGTGLERAGGDEAAWVLIERLEDEVLEAMAPLIEVDLISVRRVSYWLEVEINTNFLFSSGSATVAPEAVPVIRKLAGLLNNVGVRLQVEGHTDSVPISTAQFPSNWELSAGRAASVVHLLARYGINPATMAAVGYGEYRPVATNDSSEGRRKNRRVLLIVMSGKPQVADFADFAGPPVEQAPQAPAEPVS